MTTAWINYDPITKVPIDPVTGRGVDLTNRANWRSYQDCVRYGTTGFVIQPPYFFIDIDGALQADGTWSAVAHELTTLCAGAYVEISMSGRGLHIIGRSAPTMPHRCKNKRLGIELYTSDRYCAVTGTSAIGSFEHDCSTVIEYIIDKYFSTKLPSELDIGDNGPVSEWSGYTDDAQLIEAACNAVGSGFRNGASFKALWFGDTAELARYYPDNFGGRAYDASSADAALAQHLAFWTGNDVPRIERIMRQSALIRDKWARPDYLPRTIEGVCRRQTTFHQRAADSADISTELRVGHQFLGADQQLDYFKGCVYVCDLHRILVPWGELLKPDQFRTMFGGYIFALDALNNKTTVNAWAAFTESQAFRFPKAHRGCFRPLRAHGHIEINRNGSTLVNTWRDPMVEKRKGDPGRFLTHLEKLLPIESDRETLLNYMAGITQRQGVKFQWCPLIQGAPGNGKSLLSRCIAYSVGKQYCHFPRASEFTSRFNDWLLNRVFIGVEDIYFPEKKLHAIEILKPMITATSDDGYEIEAKGRDKHIAELTCNFILNTNHKDAIRKDLDDRRFAVFYTAQQSHADIVRDGMDGRYFPDLYDWLRREGYAIVAEYLWTYPLPTDWVETVGCHRAPATSSTAEAVSLSLGGIEQEILEAIDSGRRGFCGDWISSIQLDKLLEETKSSRRIPRNRRRKVLQDLGYDYHPAFKDGRSPRNTVVDGGKPRLFVKQSNFELMMLNDTKILVAKYEKDQQAGGE